MGTRVVYGNSSSSNGWPMVDEGSCTWTTVPGTDVSLEIQNGQPLAILAAFAADFNAYVEPLRDADSACWTATNSVGDSNHLSGTAMDLNWDSHPFQVADAGFDGAKIATIREMIDFYEGTVWWGNDWDDPKDAMHFQLGSLANGGDIDTYGNPHTQDFINRKIRADGFSTFRRDGQPTPPPPPLSRADQYALTIIQTGKKLGITPRGIQIALATALVESNLTMYANSNDPASLALPHDAVGSDHMSVGIFQQQDQGWGPLSCRMDVACSATTFYQHLERLNYNDTRNSPGWYAQKVQVSAFPDRYDQRFGDAVDLYTRLVNTPAPTPGDDMAQVPQEQWDELFREVCGQTHSQSPFRALDEGDIWRPSQFWLNDDGMTHPQYVEWAASRGDPRSVALLHQLAAADPGKYADRAEDIQLAQQVLTRLSGAAVATPDLAPVVPAPAAPTPAPTGTSTIGPSGWIGIAGVVGQAILWLLPQTISVLPPQWAAAVSGLLALLTALGIYTAPNQKESDVAPAPAAQASAPAPAPQPPAPPAPPPPPPPATGSIADALAKTQRDAAELAAKTDALRDSINKTLG
jgi:hypothetical protein